MDNDRYDSFPLMNLKGNRFSLESFQDRCFLNKSKCFFCLINFGERRFINEVVIVVTESNLFSECSPTSNKKEEEALFYILI